MLGHCMGQLSFCVTWRSKVAVGEGWNLSCQPPTAASSTRPGCWQSFGLPFPGANTPARRGNMEAGLNILANGAMS